MAEGKVRWGVLGTAHIADALVRARHDLSANVGLVARLLVDVQARRDVR